MKTVVSIRVGSVAKVVPTAFWLLGMAISALAILRLIFLGSIDFADIILAGLVPPFLALVGLAVGVVGARLYNLVAGWVGGIEIELEDSSENPATGRQSRGGRQRR